MGVLPGEYSKGSEYKSFVARATTDGKLDKLFGKQGILHLSNVNFLRSIESLPNGKFILGGNAISSKDNIQRARILQFNLDGTEDQVYETKPAEKTID